MKKLIELNEIDLAVAEFLNANKIQFFVSYQGESKWLDSKNVSDKWLIKLSMQKADQTGNLYAEFDFYTGTGNRLEVSGISYKLSPRQIDSVKSLRELLGKDRLDSTVIDKGNKQYAVSPTQASVLYCLLLDANCADQNFDDFCSDLGYDPDSRKDFKVYESCCETLQKMRKIFTISQRNELAELLQDY